MPIFNRAHGFLRATPAYSLVWGVLAASLLAAIAAGFTVANGQNALGLVVDGSGLDLSFLWPLTAASAFGTELLAWFLLITRRGQSDYRTGLVTGVVTGLVSHIPTAIGSWVWFYFLGEWREMGYILLTLFSSVYFAGWFSIPASVIVTTFLLLVARRD